MGIRANHERTLDDWPDAIKYNKNIPEHLKPRYIWSFLCEKEKCNDINVVLSEVLNKLSEKTEVISDLCKQYKLESSVVVTIQANSSNMPYIGLSYSFISFLNEIRSEISFDIYAY